MTIVLNYLDIKDINASAIYADYSIDSGNNVGVTFFSGTSAVRTDFNNFNYGTRSNINVLSRQPNVVKTRR